MATFDLTFDADGTIDASVEDSDIDSTYFDDCNDAPDGLSADYITSFVSTNAWLRLEDVPTNFVSLSALSIAVDVQALDFSEDTGTLTAQIFDSDSGGTENPLSDAQQIATESDTTRTQRTVNFGSLTGTKAQWNGAYCQLTWTMSGSSGEIRLYGARIDGTYQILVLPDVLHTRTYLGPQMRSRYGAQMLNSAIFFASLSEISEEQVLLFGADPVVDSGSLASGRWRR